MRVAELASSGIPPARGAGEAERGYGRSSGRTRQTALRGATAPPGGLGFNHRFSALYHAGPECVNGFPRTFPDTFPDRAAISHALPRRAKGTLSLIK